METRFSASVYTHCFPTSTQAAQGSGGLPAHRVFLFRHRLHLFVLVCDDHPELPQTTYATIDRLERSSDRREIPALPSTMLHETALLDGVISNTRDTIAVRGLECQEERRWRLRSPLIGPTQHEGSIATLNNTLVPKSETEYGSSPSIKSLDVDGHLLRSSWQVFKCLVHWTAMGALHATKTLPTIVHRSAKTRCIEGQHY